MFKLGYKKIITDKEVFATWLSLEKGKLNYRCPSCFMRDLDIDMFYNKDTKIYSCIRCQYRGTEEDVFSEKMRWFDSVMGAMHKRFDKFDFD